MESPTSALSVEWTRAGAPYPGNLLAFEQNIQEEAALALLLAVECPGVSRDIASSLINWECPSGSGDVN